MNVISNKKFTDTLKSDVQRPKELEEFADKIHKHIEKHGSIKLDENIFGDDYNCGGYEEEVIKPEEGGTLTRFYGCSYLYKGEIDNDTIDRLAPVKRSIIATISLLASYPFILFVPFLLIWKDRVLKESIRWIVRIYRADAIKKQLPDIRFNVAEREVIRVFRLFADRVKDSYYKNEIIDLGYLVAMILQFDSAYRFTFQDAFSKDIRTFIKTLLERENGIRIKWVWVSVVLNVLLLSRKIRRFIREFLNEFDERKIWLDEADWYYCLRRNRYNYGGFTYEERMRIKSWIDRSKGHTVIDI
jgi:hypothetical protein